MKPLESYFNQLAKTNSSEKALEAMKKTLLKRKFDSLNNKNYTEMKEELNEILDLITKDKILSMMFESK